MSGVVDREPVAVAGAVTGFVSAALVVATAFGVDLSGEQQAAVLGLLAAAVALAPIVAALWARRRTYAAENVLTAVETVTRAAGGETGPTYDERVAVAGPASVMPTGKHIGVIDDETGIITHDRR